MPAESRTVEQYVAELPNERRAAIEAVRKVIRKHLPRGYEEQLRSGMISYEIPLARFPKTYNKQPLGYAALAVQKNYNALYLMGAYAIPAQVRKLRDAFTRAGKKLDMGKSCVRFRTPEDLELDAIADAIAAIPPDEFIALHEAAHKKRP
ncbi:MAG TPA: DUF1801 domain-containing protein [Gemmatimonadaceae bacterium]|nr:DUF1801 domain-containing protein [Gemmatimonadaceae bacterium]